MVILFTSWINNCMTFKRIKFSCTLVKFSNIGILFILKKNSNGDNAELYHVFFRCIIKLECLVQQKILKFNNL